MSTAFIAASANRFSHAADVSPDSLVAIGSGNLVALWDVKVCDFYMLTNPSTHALNHRLQMI